MTKYYRDANNNYIGGFEGDTGKVPAGAVEVSYAPPDARCIWNGFTWNDPVLKVEEKEEKLGVTLESKVEALFQAIGYLDTTLLEELKVKLDQAKV